MPKDSEAIRWDGKVVAAIYAKGIKGGFKDDIVEMTTEAYNSYLAGYRRSPIIMSGEVLQRLNCEFILQYSQVHGIIEYRKRGKVAWVLKGSDVGPDFRAAKRLTDELTLCDTISILESFGIFDKETLLDMHALRHIRNSAVHSLLLPRLDPYNPPQQLSIDEIAEIIDASLQNALLPLEYRQHKFSITIHGQETEYIVNQERLGVDLEKIESQRWITAIALALLFSTMRNVDSRLPLSR